MPGILKTKKGKLGAFIGTHVSPEEFNFLSLVCAADGVTKTEIIRGLLTEWFESHFSIETEKQKVNTIAKKALTIFIENSTRKHAGKKSKDFNLFVDNLREELVKKNLFEDTIVQIENRIRVLHKKYEEK